MPSLDNVEKLYAIEYMHCMCLVARDDDRLMWEAGQSGSFMLWIDSLFTVKKIYEVKNNDIEAVWHQFYKDFPLKPSEPTVSSGWLAPDGKFFICGYMEHDNISENLTALYYDDLSGTSLLESKGWLRVWNDGTITSGLRHETVCTQLQLDAIFDLATVKDASWKEELLKIIERYKDLA